MSEQPYEQLAEETRRRLGMTNAQMSMLVQLHRQTAELYGGPIEPHNHEVLSHKLGLYIRANGSASPARLALALHEAPETMAARGEPSIRTVLQKQADRERSQWVALSDRHLPTPMIVEHVIDEEHHVVRLFTREHFKHNSEVLQHCLGGRSLERYHSKSRSRQLEVRAVCNKSGVPVTTVVYDTTTRTITQCRKVGDLLLDGSEYFFPAVEKALLYIVDSCGAESGVREIRDMEGVSAKQLFVRNYGFVSMRDVIENSTDAVLGGSVVVTHSMTDSELSAASALPVHLDMTEASEKQRSALVEVRGSISDKRGVVDGYDRLRSIGGQLKAPGAEKVRLERLETIGRGAYLETARSIELPSLQSVGGRLDVQSARQILAPRLREVKGKIDAASIEELYMPRLEYVGWHIVAPEALVVSLESLSTIDGVLIATSAKSISLPRGVGVKVQCAASSVVVGSGHLTQAGQTMVEMPLREPRG